MTNVKPAYLALVLIGLSICATTLADRLVLGHAGKDFVLYVWFGFERTSATLFGIALFLAGVLPMVFHDDSRIRALYAAMGWGGATLIVILICAGGVYAKKIDISPFFYEQSIEYEYFILAYSDVFSGMHPLLDNIYRPLVYAIPFDFIDATITHILSVFIFAAAPLLILLRIFKLLSFQPLPTMFVVVFAMFCGQYLFVPYMLMPTPFSVYDSFNFRMFAPTAFALMALFLVKRRWIVAGFFFALTSMSHPKFGIRVCELMGLLLAVLYFFPRILPNKAVISWGDAARFFGVFALVFAPSAYALLQAPGYFAQLDLPRAEPLISPLGWLIKNEPDDWLFTYLPAKIVVGSLVLNVVAALTSGWLATRLRQTNPQLAAIGSIGLVANLFALSMHLAEIVFETWGLSHLPWEISLTITLMRAWDFLWVAPLTISIISVLGAFHYLERTRFFHHALTICVMLSFVALLVPLMSAEHKERLTVREKILPKSFVDHSVLTVCSPDGAKHIEAKADALAALRKNDEVAFNASVARMRALFSSVAKDRRIDLADDIEAEALEALHSMRQGDYAAGLGSLRRQHHEIARLSPDEHPWVGDVAWRCPSQQSPGLYWDVLERPWQDYDDALSFLAKKTDAGTGIFPYPSAVALLARSKHAAFWEPGFDSHAMYMYPAYYSVGLERLNALAGEGAVEAAPGFRFGDSGENGRTFFLSRTAEDFIRLQAKYPKYKYIFTDILHVLPFPRIYTNASFAIYSCCEMADTSVRR